ncbi:MAG: four helix bundle protein [Candidatus Saganbacteria bacterium]|nr:four helix bundle protein [Candidatus Saganbacteria bacterium]
MGKGLKDLLVWQKAYGFALVIYRQTKSFPKEELYGITSQLRRAVVSVPANIAEGYERQYRKEYVQFLNMAKGSLGEVETYLLLAKDLGYIELNKFEELEEMRTEIAKLLRGLISSLKPL